jgi:mono/diheme cytochrome c family protein
MLFIKSTGIALAGLLVAMMSGIALMGQAVPASQEAQKTLKKVPITQSNAASGQQLYKDYCAACHGSAGKGDGPVVEFLKVPPPDFTTMAKRNNGEFPVAHFSAVLRFGSDSHSHGTSDMPIWGPLFRSRDLNKDQSQLMIYNLTSYVKSMQKM